jgi:hypothetical protein
LRVSDLTLRPQGVALRSARSRILGGERAATPLRQRGFYLDSKLVRGLESDRLTIGVTPNRREILWGGDRWMRSMELQFP